MARIGVYKVQEPYKAALVLGFENGKFVSYSLNPDKIPEEGNGTVGCFLIFLSHIVTCVASEECPQNAKSPEHICLFVKNKPKAFYRFLHRARKYGLLFPIRDNGKLYYLIPTLILEE